MRFGAGTHTQRATCRHHRNSSHILAMWQAFRSVYSVRQVFARIFIKIFGVGMGPSDFSDFAAEMGL